MTASQVKCLEALSLGIGQDLCLEVLVLIRVLYLCWLQEPLIGVTFKQTLDAPRRTLPITLNFMSVRTDPPIQPWFNVCRLVEDDNP